MRRMNSKLALVGAVALAASLGMVGLARGENAQTSIVDAFTNFDTADPLFLQSLSFQKFDPSLGHLDSVTLTISGDMKTMLTATATLEAAATKVWTQAFLSLYVQDAATGGNLVGGQMPVTDDSVGPLVSVNISTFGNKQAIAAGKSYEWKDLSATFNTGPNTYTNLDVLREFTGKGESFVMNVATQTDTGVFTGGGNATVSQMTTASVTGTITYAYSAVPEAATMLLGGLAAMPLLMQRRRQRGVDASAC